MSISTAHSDRESTSCTNCGDDFEHGYNANYCSSECYYRQKGEDALRNIESDHRFCSSCYKPLKVVFRPADQESPKLRTKAVVIRDSFVGFQEFTEFARQGDHGVECECGNCQHYHSERLLRDGEPYEWYLKLCFSKFRREGQIDQTFTLETFADVFWNTEDFELAVGKALHH